MSVFRLLLLSLILLALPVQAARVINSVLLDGGTVTSVSAGDTITVTMEVTTSGPGSNDDWDSTSYTLDGVTTCVDTTNANSDGTYTRSFTLTAPAADGNYTISFYAHRNAGCSPGTDSNNFTLTNGIVVNTSTGACVTYRDEFSSSSYSRQDGTASWSTDWIESGDNNNPGSGNIDINSNRLRFNGNSNATIERQADLSSYTSATLSFSYDQGGNWEPSDDFNIYASDDGGSSWNLIQQYSNDQSPGTFTTTLAASYLVNNFRLRFDNQSNSGFEDFYIDDVEVEACGAATITQLAYYAFDELGWNESAGEVIDGSGNDYHAIARNNTDTDNTSPAIDLGSTGTCGYGAFDGAGDGGNDYVELPASFPDLSGSFTIAGWINASDISGDKRIFIDDQNNTSGFGLSLGDGGDGRLRFFSRAVSPVSVDTQSAVITAGDWHFVAIVHDAASKTRQIYVDGNFVSLNTGSTSSTYTGTWGTDSGPASIGGEVAGATEEIPTQYRFNGSIDEVSVYDGALSDSDLDTLMAATHNCALLIAYYAMDETSWNGTAGEVIDSSGNSLNGQAVNGTTTADTNPDPARTETGNMGTCRYGDFLGNNSEGGGDEYLTIADNDLLDLADELTITAWIHPLAIPASGLKTIVSKDENYEFHINSSGQINWWWNNASGTTQEFDSTGVLAVGNWYHIAIVYSEGAQSIYINGVEEGSASFTGGLRTNSDPLLIGTDLGFVSSRNFNGPIDEVKIYNAALSAAEVNVLYLETHPCAVSPLDHYVITSSPTAVTCEPLTVTITAVDSGDNAVDIPAGTELTVSTDIANDGWTNPGGPGDVYTLTADAGSVVFEVRKLDPATIEIDVEDADGIDDDDGTPDDDTVVFTDAGFRFYADGVVDDIQVKVADKPSDLSSENQTMTIRAVQSSPADPGVCEALITNSTQDIGFAYRCDNPGSCPSPDDALTINSTVVNSDSTTPYTDVTIDFDAAGEGTFTFSYADAGYITLLAEADLPVSDSGGGTANVQGGSNSFLVKPAGLCVETTEVNSDCDDASCALAFKTVDEVFVLEISGRAWVNDTETDTDFCDNNLTRNFQVSNLALGSAVVSPSNGDDAVVTPNSGLAISGNTGQLDQTVSVDEVGVFTFTVTPQVAGYFGETIAASTSDNIGRFTPHHYVVDNDSLRPAAGTFTYLDQPFTVQFDISAVDSSGTLLDNYYDGPVAGDSDNFIKLAVTGDLTYGATDGSTYYTMRLNAAAPNPLPTWGSGPGATAGRILLVEVPLTLDRVAADISGVEAPLVDVAIGLAIDDADNIGLATSALDLDTELPAGDDRQQLGSLTEFRYGRAFVPPVYGPEIAATDETAIAFVIQTWDGTRFIPSDEDSSSHYEAWSELTCTDGTVSCSDVSFVAADPGAVVISGRSDNSNPLAITRPGAGNVGELLLQIDVDDWFHYDWNGTGDEDPATTVTFGTYRGHDRIIYWREVH